MALKTLAVEDAPAEEKPRFRALAPLYIRDTYLPEGTEFVLRPSDGMTPDLEALNEPARVMLTKYLDELPSPIRRLDDVVAEAYANRPKEPAVQRQVTEIRKSYNRNAPNAMGVKTSDPVEVITDPAKKISQEPKNIMGVPSGVVDLSL